MQDDTKERVALDLAVLIEQAEKAGGPTVEKRTRDYWLELYARCLKATKGLANG